MTTERLMVLALECGLTLWDFSVLTVGMIFDYIDEYIEIRTGKQPEVREATQEDFDRF